MNIHLSVIKPVQCGVNYDNSPIAQWLIFGLFQCMNRIFPNLFHLFWFKFGKFPKMNVPSIKALQLIQLGQNNILNTTNC